MRIRPALPTVLWLLMYLCLILSLLTHRSVDALVLGQYSPAFVIGLAAVAVAAVLLAVLINALARLPEDRFCKALGIFGVLRERWTVRIALIAAAGTFLVLMWLRFPDILRDVPHPYIRFCISITLLAGVYFGLFWRAPDPQVCWHLWLILGVLAAGTGIVLTMTYLTRLPMLDTLDELHNYIVQWTYARLGLLGDAVYRQMIPLPQPIYDSPHILIGLFLRLIGDNFWQARFARFLFSCLALPFIYNSGKILYGRRAGLFAVVIAFFYLAPTSFVRPDFAVGVMLSVGLYAYLKAEQVRHPFFQFQAGRLYFMHAVNARPGFSPLLHFLTGLLIGLGGEGHPLAYRFGVAFGLIYAAHWGQRMWQRRRICLDGRIVALGLGGLTAMLIYLSIHILPGLEQGLHFAQSYAPSARTSGEQVQAAFSIFNRQIEVWIESSPIEAWIALVALLLAFVRMGRGDRLILTILLVSEVLMLATYGYYRAFYQVHFLPLFTLLMGKALADGFDLTTRLSAVRNRASQLVIAGMVLCVSVAAFADTGANELADPPRDEFESIGAQLAATLPPSAIVVANEDYFLKMPSLNFYGISTVATDSWFLVKLQGVPLWEATHPDVFVLTPGLDLYKYVPLTSIYTYMYQHDFKYVRCYTGTGLFEAQVWVRSVPPGWDENDLECKNWSGTEISRPAPARRVRPNIPIAPDEPKQESS